MKNDFVGYLRIELIIFSGRRTMAFIATVAALGTVVLIVGFAVWSVIQLFATKQ
ncbi:MAG TPA: hypothetical protein VIU93_11000 [Gallionellaceae bacterium]